MFLLLLQGCSWKEGMVMVVGREGGGVVVEYICHFCEALTNAD